MAKAYKAKWIISASQQGQNVYENSALIVEEDKIAAIIPQENVAEENFEEVIDYKNSIITPGFINLGTKLEFSKIDKNLVKVNSFKRFLLNLKQFFCMLGTPINSYPMQLSSIYKEYKLFSKKEKIESVKFGVEKSLLNGITCVAEITNEDLVIEVLNKLPIKKYYFFDLKSDSKNESKKVFFKLKKKIEKLLKNKKNKIKIGLYPHSIWSVHKSLWGVISKYARKNKLPLMTEILESEDEKDFVEYGKSNLDYLNNFLGCKKIKYEKGKSAVEYLNELKVIDKNLIIKNGNFLTEEELLTLYENEVKFVYSPLTNKNEFKKSHSRALIQKYFPERFVFCTNQLSDEGKFSILNEIFEVSENIQIEELIKYLTIYPAKILNISKTTGSLEPDKDADFNVFKLDKKQNMITDLRYNCNPTDVFISGQNIVKNGNISIN